MSVTSGIVLYAVTWFLVLYMVLPLFVRNQEEAGEVEPGTSAGAPDKPLMKKKIIWTTIAATIVWAALVGVIMSGWISISEIARWFGRPQ